MLGWPFGAKLAPITGLCVDAAARCFMLARVSCGHLATERVCGSRLIAQRLIREWFIDRESCA